MRKMFLEAGRVVGTHGIRGEMRVDPWSDTPDFLASFKKIYLDDKGENCLKIKARAHKNIVLVKADGIDTIEDAERYRGKTVFIDRKDVKLEEGRYFLQDILQSEVFDADTDKLLGVLTDVSKTGANDVWHITKDGKEYLIPSIPDVVIDVDIDASRVIIRPLKGIFDDED
ncbi:MAG: 16S rRNA processing protein RimM [Clostridia bacterium]|nr:16S rRNA processing protein RimM [Clostridia bacterium]